MDDYDRRWERLYQLLRQGYWHVTSPQNWDAIRQAGVIAPNINGKFGVSWDYISQRSYGYINQCISLFDFGTPTKEEVLGSWGHSRDILIRGGVTVALQLDQCSLVPLIRPNSEARGKPIGCVPFCEVWYPNEIPLSAVRQVYVHDVSRSFRGEFTPTPVGFHDYIAPYQPQQGSA